MRPCSQEAEMFGDEIFIGIRNILFMHLMILATVPERTVRLHHELVKIWKTLKTPILPKKTGPVKKGSKFWEIDMTKFEP
jgi:hypothetical protein